MVYRPGPSWWIKICDFGISKRTEGSTALRTVIGTPAYMAPELLHQYPPGESELASSDDVYTSAVDIWALGEITSQMLTGKNTFSDGRRLHNYVVRGHAFPTELLNASGCSPECSGFIQKCMAPSPRNRLVAAEALQHDWLANHEDIDDDGYVSDPR